MNTDNISKQDGTKISERKFNLVHESENFSNYIRAKRKEVINKSGKKVLSTRELSVMIGIDYTFSVL